MSLSKPLTRLSRPLDEAEHADSAHSGACPTAPVTDSLLDAAIAMFPGGRRIGGRGWVWTGFGPRLDPSKVSLTLRPGDGLERRWA
jgi:hypothetical protein